MDGLAATARMHGCVMAVYFQIFLILAHPVHRAGRITVLSLNFSITSCHFLIRKLRSDGNENIVFWKGIPYSEILYSKRVLSNDKLLCVCGYKIPFNPTIFFADILHLRKTGAIPWKQRGLFCLPTQKLTINRGQWVHMPTLCRQSRMNIFIQSNRHIRVPQNLAQTFYILPVVNAIGDRTMSGNLEIT